MVEYNDNTPMPFGKFQGTMLVDVPAWHLLWLFELPQPINNQMLLDYISDNYETLEKERNSNK